MDRGPGLGTLSVALALDIAKMESGAEGVKAAFSGLSGVVSGFADQVNPILGTVVSAIGQIASESIGLAMEFDQTMVRISALTGTAAEQLREWSLEIPSIGAAYGRSAKETADALYFIASSGLSGQKATDALTVSLKASAVGLGETKTIADTVTSVMNAYGDQIASAAQVTDILTQAVKLGKAEPEQFAASLYKVIPSAAQLGVSFQDVAGAMAAMTLKGAPAAQAGTQLSGVMNALSKPSRQAAELLAGVGLSAQGLRDDLATDGLLPTMEKLYQAFNGNEEAISRVMGRIEATRGIFSLAGKSVEQTRQVFDGMGESTGVLDDALGKTRQSAGFLAERIGSEVKGAFLELGSATLPIVTEKLREMVITVDNTAIATAQATLLSIGAWQKVGYSIGEFADDAEAIFGTFIGKTIRDFGALSDQDMVRYEEMKEHLQNYMDEAEKRRAEDLLSAEEWTKRQDEINAKRAADEAALNADLQAHALDRAAVHAEETEAVVSSAQSILAAETAKATAVTAAQQEIVRAAEAEGRAMLETSVTIVSAETSKATAMAQAAETAVSAATRTGTVAVDQAMKVANAAVMEAEASLRAAKSIVESEKAKGEAAVDAAKAALDAEKARGHAADEAAKRVMESAKAQGSVTEEATRTVIDAAKAQSDAAIQAAKDIVEAEKAKATAAVDAAEKFSAAQVAMAREAQRTAKEAAEAARKIAEEYETSFTNMTTTIASTLADAKWGEAFQPQMDRIVGALAKASESARAQTEVLVDGIASGLGKLGPHVKLTADQFQSLVAEGMRGADAQSRRAVDAMVEAVTGRFGDMTTLSGDRLAELWAVVSQTFDQVAGKAEESMDRVAGAVDKMKSVMEGMQVGGGQGYAGLDWATAAKQWQASHPGSGMSLDAIASWLRENYERAVTGLAGGGIVPETPGGRLMRVAEGGSDEAVIPLDRGMGRGFGGDTYYVTVTVAGSVTAEKDLAESIRRTLLQKSRATLGVGLA